MLSAAATRTIRDQINQDNEVVQNQSAMNEVLKALPGAPVIKFQSLLCALSEKSSFTDRALAINLSEDLAKPSIPKV